jgi:hypothetical protein
VIEAAQDQHLDDRNTFKLKPMHSARPLGQHLDSRERPLGNEDHVSASGKSKSLMTSMSSTARFCAKSLALGSSMPSAQWCSLDLLFKAVNHDHARPDGGGKHGASDAISAVHSHLLQLGFRMPDVQLLMAALRSSR